MRVLHKYFSVDTGIRINFFDITSKIREIVSESGLSNGIVNVFSQHTSCSVFIQEDSEDVTAWNSTPLILQDTVNVLEKIIPTCQYQGQYLHPGNIHMQHAMEWRQEKPEWLLNTDAHLRSVLLGRSATIPLSNGEMILGEFGVVYFADFDQTRERHRTVIVTLIAE
jgi:secondary thiamine-phosphate synthase enzyme